MPTAVFLAMNCVVEAVAARTQVDIVPALLDSGIIDMVISALIAYQLMDKPEDASVTNVWFGLYMIDRGDLASPAAKPIVDK